VSLFCLLHVLGHAGFLFPLFCLFSADEGEEHISIMLGFKAMFFQPHNVLQTPNKDLKKKKGKIEIYMIYGGLA